MDIAEKLKIGVMGATGRMGQALVESITSQDTAPYILDGYSTRFEENAEIITSSADLIIDFTSPCATMQHIDHALKHKTAMVIGTTGLNDEEMQKLRNAAEHIPIVYASNTSIGVTLLMSLVEQAAANLKEEFDIEIFEAHHKNKIDAPSGTALSLGASAAKGRGSELDQLAVYDRHGQTTARKSGEIGFSVMRGGDIAGEHTVSFIGDAERLELTHKATDRKIFARGALQAAIWLQGKPQGLYTMKEVLGL